MVYWLWIPKEVLYKLQYYGWNNLTSKTLGFKNENWLLSLLLSYTLLNVPNFCRLLNDSWKSSRLLISQFLQTGSCLLACNPVNPNLTFLALSSLTRETISEWMNPGWTHLRWHFNVSVSLVTDQQPSPLSRSNIFLIRIALGTRKN